MPAWRDHAVKVRSAAGMAEAASWQAVERSGTGEAGLPPACWPGRGNAAEVPEGTFVEGGDSHAGRSLEQNAALRHERHKDPEASSSSDDAPGGTVGAEQQG
ncbi:MAG: hypothetical protein EOP84_10865 [Verrucomicrobiaceae bacterium]|nr:MAG: hypothetical protein EOP84_10865 [Verrucomicrobiaceae bacterium]